MIITAKTLRDQRRALIGWSIGVAALVLLYASFYPSIKANAAQLDKYFESLPEALRNAIGTGTISSPVGYLRSEIFSTMGPLLLLILAIGAGARAIAGEEERKTLDLLLANPVTRRTAVLQKFWAMVGATAGVGLVLVAAIAVFGPAFGLHVALIDILAASVSAVALAVSFGAVALAVGCWRGRRGVAIAVATTLAVASYLLNVLAPSVDVHRAAPGPLALLPLHRPRSAPHGLQPAAPPRVDRDLRRGTDPGGRRVRSTRPRVLNGRVRSRTARTPERRAATGWRPPTPPPGSGRGRRGTVAR